MCSPGETRSCYSGPDGTEGVGECKAGTETCAGDGQSWGECQGEVTPTPETCTFTTDEDCNVHECARWSLISSGPSLALTLGMKADSQGNVVLYGVFTGVVGFGGIDVDATSGGVFLAKLDADGSVAWVKNFGPPPEGNNLPQVAAFDCLAIDQNDDILIAGNFEGALNLGGGALTADGKDFFVAKFTKNGAHAWSKKFGGAMAQEVWEIVADAQGALVTGVYGNGFLIGGSSVPGAGVFVSRLDISNGSASVVQHFDPNTGSNAEPHLTLLSDGGWAVAGNCNDGGTIAGASLVSCTSFAAKFGPDDALQWAVDVPVNIQKLAAAPSGAVLLAGHFQGTIDMGMGPLNSQGASDVLLTKLDALEGSTAWARAFGGPADNEYSWLTSDATGRIYLGLATDDSIDFGGGALDGAGLSDAFVVTLDGEGNHLWSRVFGDATDQTGIRLAVREPGLGLIVSALLFGGEIDFGAGTLAADGLGIAVADLAP